MAANAQLFRQRKGIGFRLEIDFVDVVRVDGAEEMLRAAAVVAADKASRELIFPSEGSTIGCSAN
jgi:hypothetical protein